MKSLGGNEQRWRAAAVVLTAFLSWIAVAAQTKASDPRELKLGKTFERKIETGQTHEYRLRMRPGQVLFVELDELSFDAKVELIEAASARSAVAINLGGGFERETLTFEAVGGGEYLLRVSDAEDQSIRGAYRLRVTAWDAAGARDRARIEAERLSMEAALRHKENTASALREAIGRRERALTLWREAGDRYWESHTLNRLGAAHNQLLENNRAVEYLDRALAIVSELGDNQIHADSLNGYGSVVNGFGEYRQAIQYHERALKMFQSARVNLGVAISLQFLGNSHAWLKDYAKADEYYRRSLEAARRERNGTWEANALYLLGSVLELRNDQPKALEHYERALALWRETKNDTGIAHALLSAGRILTSRGETEKASEYLNEALRLYKAKKNRGAEASAHNALSILYNRMGKKEESIEALKWALAYYQEFKSRHLEISVAGLIASLHNNHGNREEAIRYAEMALATEEVVAERTAEASRKENESFMRESKAMVLGTLGSVYFNAGNNEKSLDYFSRALAFFEKMEGARAKQQVAMSLDAIAQIHRVKYEWDKARETYERSLSIARELDNKYFHFSAVNSLGLIHNSTGEEKKALKYFEEALDLLRAVRDRGDAQKRFEADLLGNIGDVHMFLGDPARALDYHNQALAVRQSIKSVDYVDGQAITYLSIASVYSYQGRKREALELLDRALELFRQAPAHVRALARNRTTEASILGRIGYLHKEMGNPREAMKHFEDVLAAAVAARNLDLESSTHNNIGQIKLLYGEPQQALRHFNRALELTRKIGDTSGEPALLNNIALVYSYWGDQREALKYVTQALGIAERLGNKLRIATFLGNIGSSYRELSENEKALEYYKRSLALARELGNRSSEATILNNMAFLASSMGERGRAVALFEEALTVARSIGEKNLEATILGNLSFEHLELGENERALELRTRALGISRESGDKLGEVSSLQGLGNILRRIGEREKRPERVREAVEHYERALKLSREAESKLVEASVLVSLGLAHVELGEAEKALPLLKLAGDYARRYQSRLTEGMSHYALGRLHERADRLEEATDEYLRAATVARSISDRDVEAKSLRGLMTAWRARGNDRTAMFYGKQAVNAFQQLRGSIRNLRRETQDVFRDHITEAYRELSSLLIENERFAEAEQVLGMLKEAEFGHSVVRRNDEKADNIPYSTAESEVLSKVENLIALERERAELNRNPDTLTERQNQRLEELGQEISAANVAFQKTLDSLETAAAKRGGEIRLARSIQGPLTRLGEMTKSRVVALYTVLATGRERDRSGLVKPRFGWVVMYTPDGSKAYPIDTTNLNEMVFQFRDALRTDRHDPRPVAEKIYAAIFRQTSPRQKRTLEADLRDYMGAEGSGTVMWSLDGVLRYVPMAALHDGEHYLVERYRHVTLSNHSSHSLAEGNRPEWEVLGLGVSEAREEFAALPGVRTELETIVRQPNSPGGIFDGTIQLNQDFKKQPFFNAVRRGRFPVVHIASHYSFNPARPESSFLLVGDGRLTFGEMDAESSLFGKIDLLTLSACDTAMSANGEESEGFAFLAQKLGAKSVIASLWKVSDAGTPELMIRFYRLRAGEQTIAKGEAFRRAQLSLLYGDDRRPGAPPSAQLRGTKLAGQTGKTNLLPYVKDTRRPYAHPHYWASFVLIGNWK